MTDRLAALRAALGRVGVFSFPMQGRGAADGQAAVAAFEALGFRSTWFPETIGSKEALSNAGLLLSASTRMIVGTGIANIYARDPMAMANGARSLGEAYPGRFVLGIGVSHAPSVARRGSVYERPIARMTAYLDAMDSAAYSAPLPAQPVPVILAALGPRMLELAAARADGALPYFVPVEHTAIARQRLGKEPLLIVEQVAVLDADRARARETGRAFSAHYLALPNYANNLRRLGFGDDDIAAGGSDRLIDALVVQGDAGAIAARVREHLDAGADHVCVQLRAPDPGDFCLPAFGELRAALGNLLASPAAAG